MIFQRRLRPRVLGERRPHYSVGARDCFVHLGSCASRVVYAFTATGRDDALRDLSAAFEVCKLHANDILLEIIQHYCLVVHAYTCGNTDRAEVDRAQEKFYAACREALGTND